jgi:hypothetical protein|tara:strand:+ start:1183 stop:1332 length:150 start_codon:yes stop_codon:yes gene_type:complete
MKNKNKKTKIIWPFSKKNKTIYSSRIFEQRSWLDRQVEEEQYKASQLVR